ncbi:MAG: hypothetical protein CL878_14020 [Dehalococcoidia bacterium]|nr:hypothetical protein [Dehalococcoidia bacterium]
MANEPIVFYCKTTCPWCMAVHNLFGEHDIAYDERDLTRHPELRAELRTLTKQEEVPTLRIGNDWLIDTDVQLVADRLGLPRPAEVKTRRRLYASPAQA